MPSDRDGLSFSGGAVDRPGAALPSCECDRHSNPICWQWVDTVCARHRQKNTLCLSSMTRVIPVLEKLAVETFSVVLGIVLALAANAWHDRRTHEQAACEALRAIGSELKSNDSVLHDRLPYHTAMRDSLAALLARTRGSDVPGGLRAIDNWSGLRPTPILDDAWQTARSTQELQYLPYELVIGLSRTYAMQQRITDTNRGFYAAVYTPAFAAGGVAAIAAMQSFLGDLTSNEGHLQAQLDSSRRSVARYCQSE